MRGQSIQSWLSFYLLVCREAILIVVEKLCAKLSLMAAITMPQYTQCQKDQTSVFEGNDKEYKFSEVHLLEFMHQT